LTELHTFFGFEKGDCHMGSQVNERKKERKKRKEEEKKKKETFRVFLYKAYYAKH
jgi:hypothetical protein